MDTRAGTGSVAMVMIMVVIVIGVGVAGGAATAWADDAPDDQADDAPDAPAGLSHDDARREQVAATPLAPATDDGVAAEPRLMTPQHAPRRWPGHRHQLGVSLQSGVGLRGIKTYDDEYCGVRGSDGAANAPMCTGRTPAALDLGLSWGATDGLELLVETRVGLERDFAAAASGAPPGPRALRIAPGFRVYFGDAGRATFFSTLQAVIDVTDYRDQAGRARGSDLGARNVNAFQLDLHPAYGLYVFAGETATLRRWIDAELEAGIGIQGRYP